MSNVPLHLITVVILLSLKSQVTEYMSLTYFAERDGDIMTSALLMIGATGDSVSTEKLRRRVPH